MSAHRDPNARTSRARGGFALLVAIITLVLLGFCAAALWQTQVGSLRSDRLGRAVQRRDAQADSMLAVAVAATHAGAWRALTQPGPTAVVSQRRTISEERSATITRLGWQSVLVRGMASGRSGVPGVRAKAEQRLLIPLTAPVTLPRAAVSGGQPWLVDPSAVVDTSAASMAELGCRNGTSARAVTIDTTPFAFGALPAIPVDPDTVSAPVRGVIRLIRDRITRPMVVDGMVESVTGLLLGADLQLAGVLVVQGSVQSAGGRLDVTGAVITRDSGGGRSVLGNGDRVRYDACAIRRAIERLTRPAPAATWTIVGHF